MAEQASLILASVAVALGSYLLGSVSWAVIISKVFYHQDIRNFGSGNAGMTNVLRTFGKGAAASVALGDFSKSIITVLASRLLFAQFFSALPFDIGYIAGIFTILGHLFPIYFGFRGGKGVLTALGMILVIDWKSFLIVIGLGLIVLFASRIVSLASITGAVLYPIVTAVLHNLQGSFSWIDFAGCLAIALIVIYMHRANIKRLLEGTEYRFGKPRQ